MTKKIIATLILIITFNYNSFAWEGVNLETNSPIEIGAGNLVREGLVIEFYEDGDLHIGRVETMNEVSGGTELLIADFNENNTEKTFLMYK